MKRGRGAFRFSGFVGDRRHEVDLTHRDGQVHAVVDGRRYALSVTEPQAGVFSILKDGASHEAVVQLRGGAAFVRLAGRLFQVEPGRGDAGRPGAGAGGTRVGQRAGRLTLTAVMPGRVVRVHVREGDAVKTRQGLVVLEAMKMENELSAPRDGTVRQVLVKPGATVETGDPLVVIE